MPLLRWLFGSRQAAKPAAPPSSSGLSRMEATRPVGRNKHQDPPAPANNAQPANRKNERMARRELLYNVVRGAMLRAGVLSASYKFKVLSLDGRGRQFLVMVDLARQQAGDVAKLAEIEAMIAQSAKARHDILVTAVYWRTSDHVAVGDPALAKGAPSVAAPPLAPVPEPVAVAQPLAPVTAPLSRGNSPFEPIHDDEVAAFREALASGATLTARLSEAAGEPHGASARAFDGSTKHGPQSYTLLTGFEDTELPDSDRKTDALSGTQYGELR